MTRFEAYEDLEGRWRWRLLAANHRIIASSAESFDSHRNAVRAADAVKAHTGKAFVSSDPGLGIKAALRLKALIRAGANDGPTPRRAVPVARGRVLRRRVGALPHRTQISVALRSPDGRSN
jgi:uncharacterized protein YegP (UPF0339 family)